MQTSLVNFMYNANISFSLKTEIGAKQTAERPEEILGLTLWKILVSILTYDPINTTSYITCICLFYKIVVSCITKCVTKPQIKLTMIR